MNRIIHEFEIERSQTIKQISQKFSLLIMLFAVSLVYSKAAYSNEDAFCKNSLFFGLDNPLEEIAASVEISSDLGGTYPIRSMSKNEDGFLLRSVYGPTFISYNFETEQIMQLGGYGFLPNWVHDASIDVGPEIITHFIGYFLNVGGWQVLDVKMSGMEFEEISLFHGQGHEEIEACEAPNCGCVGIAKIYDFDGHLGPTYSILWRR